MADPFDLERFVKAQAPIFDTALEELKAGRKRGHWMWYVFPQLRGLGESAKAQFYGISSFGEARAYLAHRVLLSRLQLCTVAVLINQGRTLNEIFGSPDDMKFASSMTLFARACANEANAFRDALDIFCEGRLDPRTQALLA